MRLRSCEALLLLLAGLCGCTSEARNVGPAAPQTPPQSDFDLRIPAYQENFNQVSQGGRYFLWYGCAGCHNDTAAGGLDLPGRQWHNGGGFAHVYASIAGGHGRLDYGRRIPAEQLWQLTAYVRDLPGHHPEKRRRIDADGKAEPQASSWRGPM